MRWVVLLALSLGFVACRVQSHQPIQNDPAAVLPVQPLPLSSAKVEATPSATQVSPAAEAESDVALTPSDAGTQLQQAEYAFQQADVLKRPVARNASASRHANLSPGACASVLRTKKYPFKRVGALKGVATPVRVDGEIEGVKFRVPGNKSKFGVLDCRLALTLVEFARFLKAASVTEVVVDNFYRPNARLPSRRSKRSQHAYGLAIDLMSLTLVDGRVLRVEDDWGASVDTEPCGAEAWLFSPTSNTIELRDLMCALASEQIFHHHLTPSYDLAHRNHLHLDIKRDEHVVTVR